MQSLCALGTFTGLFQCEQPLSQEVQTAYYEHVGEYGLSFGTTEEFMFRMNEFARNDAAIQEINASQDSYTLGHNFMSTWTYDEYVDRMLGYVAPEEFVAPEVAELSAENLAASVDWRGSGAIGAVKNQGQCGSCWAFSAMNSVEAAHQIKTGTLYTLAEQQLVSCDTRNWGCQGGIQHYAFDYLMAHKAKLETEYPYTSGSTGSSGYCNSQDENGWAQVGTYYGVQPNSVSALKAAIGQVSVSVALQADSQAFQFYSSGVLNDTTCGTSINHAVNAVGYGTSGGVDYYIVRNSWGSGWGDQGYINIAAVDGAGICGIQQQSVYPTAK